jgi:hypothetical protein
MTEKRKRTKRTKRKQRRSSLVIEADFVFRYCNAMRGKAFKERNLCTMLIL